MAELTTKTYDAGGLTEDFITDVSNMYDWEKIEINDERTQIDLYISEALFYRFRSSSSSTGTTAFEVVHRGTAVVTHDGISSYVFPILTVLKTNNAVMFQIKYTTNKTNGTTPSYASSWWIAAKVRNIETDEEKGAAINVTMFSTSMSSNRVTIYTDDVDISNIQASTYTMSIFNSVITSIAPLSNHYSKYVAKSVYAVHSSQLGGIDLHAPALINNVNYYLYCTLAFKE